MEASRGQEGTGVAGVGFCGSDSHHMVIHRGALGLRSTGCDLPSRGASRKHCGPEHLGQTPQSSNGSVIYGGAVLRKVLRKSMEDPGLFF